MSSDPTTEASGSSSSKPSPPIPIMILVKETPGQDDDIISNSSYRIIRWILYYILRDITHAMRFELMFINIQPEGGGPPLEDRVYRTPLDFVNLNLKCTDGIPLMKLLIFWMSSLGVPCSGRIIRGLEDEVISDVVRVLQPEFLVVEEKNDVRSLFPWFTGKSITWEDIVENIKCPLMVLKSVDDKVPMEKDLSGVWSGNSNNTNIMIHLTLTERKNKSDDDLISTTSKQVISWVLRCFIPTSIKPIFTPLLLHVQAKQEPHIPKGYTYKTAADFDILMETEESEGMNLLRCAVERMKLVNVPRVTWIVAGVEQEEVSKEAEQKADFLVVEGPRPYRGIFQKTPAKIYKYCVENVNCPVVVFPYECEE